MIFSSFLKRHSLQHSPRSRHRQRPPHSFITAPCYTYMSSGAIELSKPLPLPARDELPLPPPPPPPHTSPLPAPPPPPKIMSDIDAQESSVEPKEMPNSLTDFVPGASRVDSATASTAKVKQKKASPLSDLMDSELVYVDLLSGIIRVRRSSSNPLQFLTPIIRKSRQHSHVKIFLHRSWTPCSVE